jgi:hypothetical protein
MIVVVILVVAGPPSFAAEGAIVARPAGGTA